MLNLNNSYIQIQSQTCNITNYQNLYFIANFTVVFPALYFMVINE